MTTKQKNVRPLDEIADNIHKLERKSMVDVGDLLIEARSQCEHGEWLDWLQAEFEWSDTTAARYMAVANLVNKFPKLKNLKLTKTTLYGLIDGVERDLPAIIQELTKHATNSRLKARDAERVIDVGIGRSRIGDGDYPDATLALLGKLEERSDRYGRLLAALQEHRPDTDETASSIVNEVIDGEFANHSAAKVEGDEEINDEAEEAESILDGAPPVLPPPTRPPAHQKLGAQTDWAETALFEEAVGHLLSLRAKPAARFAGAIPSADLNEVANFLSAVAAADKKETA
jgi:hypothetical protein